ncbi:MAG: tryptophan--tRNA ligase, partial [Deltaproteobacteria bacterium]
MAPMLRPGRMLVLSGVQASGKLHLGNYFGALRQFVELQAQHDCMFFVADLHGLNTVQHGAQMQGLAEDVALDYLALGLDPKRAIIFRQSDVPLHAELCWVLLTVTPMGLLERAHSYKDKLARGLQATAGLFTYPVLMAADILLYAADAVPVGRDQKQHLEIARDVCQKFNSIYVPGFDPQDPAGATSGAPGVLKLPEPMILPDVEQVVGTDGQKMSKSYHNTLDLFGPEAVLRKKIMGMPTDSTPVEAPKPADAPLLQLLTLLAPSAEVDNIRRSWAAGGVGYGSYKKQLFAYCMDRFGAARAQK